MKEEEEDRGVRGEAAPPSAKPGEVFEAWNAAAEECGWGRAAVLSRSRGAALKARIKEKFFAENWRAALGAMKANSFFSGENARGWVAGIDFFLRPDSVPKIVEGFYAQHKTPSRRQATDHSKGFWQ